MNKIFKQHFIKAMKILDDLNELMSNIDYDKMYSDEVLEKGEYELLTILYYGIEDTETKLSDSLYDSGLYQIYEESEEK